MSFFSRQSGRRAVGAHDPGRVIAFRCLLADVDNVVKHAAVGDLASRTGLEEQVGRIKVHLEYNSSLNQLMIVKSRI